jgi:hypothetical protein
LGSHDFYDKLEQRLRKGRKGSHEVRKKKRKEDKEEEEKMGVFINEKGYLLGLF